MEERLARLRVLVWIAQADGEIQPWEYAVLHQVWQTLGIANPDPDFSAEEGQSHTPDMTFDRVLREPVAIPQLLTMIQSPDSQKATYAEAVAIAHLDGITPAEEQRLAQLRQAFQLAPSGEITNSPREWGDSPADGKEPNAEVETPLDSPPDASAWILNQPIDWAVPTVSGRGIVLGMRRLINHSRQVRSLIFDYALGAAMIGLIPVPSLRLVQLLGLVILLIKLRRDVGAHWGFPKGMDGLAWISHLFGWIGALAIAFMAWLTVIGLGIWYPPLQSLALAAAFATLTWTVGQSVNHYYMSTSRLDVAALRRVLQRHSQRSSHRNGWQPLRFLKRRNPEA